MRIRSSKLMLTAVGAAVLTLGLAGCSAGQSVADACKLVTDGTAEVQTTANELMTGATSGDTAAIEEGIATISAKLDEIGGTITNDEVKPVFDDFSTAYAGLTDQITAISEIDAATADAETVQGALDGMETATTALTDAQAELTTVCTA